ncbi:uncharacterized protein LOC136027125 [Artemia franciscana]|uniref:Uncharacterized protein n=1 Tax=Artemia franciscana TaxID=6661 RepID=A0AA88HIE1_ARTSF|nr:hypothetical protein QYM36_013289 [Artemia franciscana]
MTHTLDVKDVIPKRKGGSIKFNKSSYKCSGCKKCPEDCLDALGIDNKKVPLSPSSARPKKLIIPVDHPDLRYEIFENTQKDQEQDSEVRLNKLRKGKMASLRTLSVPSCLGTAIPSQVPQDTQSYTSFVEIKIEGNT